MQDRETTGRLAPLDDLDDYELADGEPDIRGWEVTTADRRKVGKVEGLIVDTGMAKVRYLDVELDRKALGLQKERHALIPISDARLDDDRDDVVLTRMTAADMTSLPPFVRGGAIAAGGTQLRETDPKQFYGKRGGSGDVRRTTLSEEELRVGKRQRQAGEVTARTNVETRHVSEKVPLMHEEVSVERHALSADAPDRDGISEGEIRIPVMAEEAVVEKRTVPKEEVVITKKRVQGEETVEADLRKERVDIDRSREDRDPASKRDSSERPRR